ncbi:MAG: hypothetical protein K8T91_10370 [Planctomycetes bacterium]|nr:hypothetical protein [Planctomycetota bacterium]
MKRLAIAITALAVVALLVWAVFRAWTSRELILETNRLPLANLQGNIMPRGVAGSPIVPTRTDPQGRLDLTGVPWGTEQIFVSLWDGTTQVRVRNSFIQLPPRGFRMVIDFRGRRTICTTTTIYADFGFFKFSRQEVLTWDREFP